MLLSLTGGYLDAFTWLLHDGVLANSQTANVVLLGVYAAAGNRAETLHHIPPILAFVIGVFVASYLRRRAPHRNRQISLAVEIAILALVMLLHVHLPEVAGILGICFAAALQTTSFTKVEGWSYSSVMTTGNLRQSAEALFAMFTGPRNPMQLRQALVFGILCACFGVGAASGAFVTDWAGPRALAAPILLLLLSLALCELDRRHHAAGKDKG